MVWILSAIALGLGLGVLGYYFSKAAYSLFLTSMSLFVFSSGIIAEKLGVERPAGVVKVPGGEEGSQSVLAVGNVFFRAIDNMGMLPHHIQLSIVCFIVAFFLARIVTWGYVQFYPKKVVVEDKAARRKRVLAQYGYTDGKLPY